jgi:hypothetical protein
MVITIVCELEMVWFKLFRIGHIWHFVNTTLCSSFCFVTVVLCAAEVSVYSTVARFFSHVLMLLLKRC